MSRSTERLGVGLGLAILAVFALIAMLTPQAKATEVLPAQNAVNTTASANLDPTQFSWFIPANAYLPAAVGCINASADFLIPPSQLVPAQGYFNLNKNKTNIGTYSADSGGVIANLDGPPSFTNCAVYDLTTVPGLHAEDYGPPGSGKPVPTALITGVTVDTKGQWTVSFDNINGTDVVAAIAVPGEGAEITIPNTPTACVIDVTQTQNDHKAQSAMADFYNGDAQTDARLEVDTQLKYTEDPSSTSCSGLGIPVVGPTKDDAISQFEADFIVTSAQGPVQVIP